MAKEKKKTRDRADGSRELMGGGRDRDHTGRGRDDHDVDARLLPDAEDGCSGTLRARGRDVSSHRGVKKHGQKKAEKKARKKEKKKLKKVQKKEKRARKKKHVRKKLEGTKKKNRFAEASSSESSESDTSSSSTSSPRDSAAAAPREGKNWTADKKSKKRKSMPDAAAETLNPLGLSHLDVDLAEITSLTEPFMLGSDFGRNLDPRNPDVKVSRVRKVLSVMLSSIQLAMIIINTSDNTTIYWTFHVKHSIPWQNCLLDARDSTD